jgi:hypothetical protein
MTASQSGPGPLRHFYGSDPSQFGDLYLPAGQRRTGTLVLFHGGWWGPKYGADSLDGAAADLATRGWAVGQDALLLEVEGSHFSIADTSSAAWPTVLTAVEELTGS